MTGNKAQEAMEKYMTPVPSYLANLVEYLNRELESLPDWERELILRLKDSVQKNIKEHFETTATTRQKFVSMAADQWQDKDNAPFFNLTEQPRKVLGYLPKPELNTLDDLVRVPLTEAVEACRKELAEMLENMRASDSDKAEVQETLDRTTFYFADLEKHHQELQKWRPLADKKIPTIQTLADREEFLDEIEEFEAKASGDPDRYKKTNSLAIADENKFRAYAAKKLKELDSEAIKLCRKYESDTRREFQIDGIKYLEMIKEQKYGRSDNPSLCLAKLRPQAISLANKQKYVGASPTNLLVVDREALEKKSFWDNGADPKIITHKSHE